MIVGSGGREHAIAAKVATSPLVKDLLCAPGNGGTAAIARNVPVNPEDVAAVVALAKSEKVDFVIVGPEAPLVLGLVDALNDAGILAFGPKREAARMEGSKVWSKQFMQRHGVPTAESAMFSEVDAAEAFVKKSGKAWVVKADGLAAGTGVVVAADVAETLEAIDRIMRKREFGEAGAQVVLEERLFGQEVSYHVILDGERFVPLAAAQDHKRLQDHDLGPNTGGMGAYSPPPVVTAEVEKKILERVVAPSVAGFKKDGVDFRGALFIGLMVDDGEPKVLEYNVRFGDPETEVLMARYGGDVLPLFLGSARGDLRDVKPRWETPASLCVVIAAPGYPGTVKKGLPITGLDAADRVPGVRVLHAGTKREGDTVTANGGRVLCVTASGPNIDAVAASAYAAVDQIRFEGMQFRRDIGHHARSKA
ncbi:MAG TPA: phosphoribosylamine--glycine ligase [Polyangiales bacterium]|nr:phosphoribosylamine--glycine ligase [Polyangiales bacterium]